MLENTNLRPPDFAPGYPVYPVLEQLCRVTDCPCNGTTPRVYPGVVQQAVPPLDFRDAEDCYVLEANNIFLVPAIYDCRLIGNYNGLPLYAVTCCGAGSSSSSGR
jgi:hypothetical protein